ncbi:MAG TPA: hypothetical protein VEL52_04555 [Candidatus Bathyarchaeia archaeon]|nr:hypothetical protein [Candidatus Dormibacteraeota bacterium]HYU87944.1 hypothetical protein [Candidatus Bathyarchaeia archaeon]
MTIWLKTAEKVGFGGSILSYSLLISSNSSLEILTEYGIVTLKLRITLHYTTLRTSHYAMVEGS